MEYFEVDKTAQIEKNKQQNKNKHSKLIYFIGIFIFIILIIVAIFNNLSEKKINPSLENRNENENKIINEDKINSTYKNKSELELIKESPYLHTKYIFNLLNNYKKLDLSKFTKNVNKIKQKIYSIINNKKENQDLYILLSTIYGAFLADSMGSFCEFKSFNKNNHLSIFNKNSYSIFKPGQITDDSEMAMSQAFALMDNPNYKTINEHLIFYYYSIWYNSHPLDIGITTKIALNTLDLNNVNITNDIIFSEQIKTFIKRKNNNSLANGLLMRISPLLSWFYATNKNYFRKILESKSPEKFYELYNKIFLEVEKDSQLTHPNRENAVAGSIFILMGLCAMEQKYTGKEIINMLNILFEHNDFNIKKEENTLKNYFINALNDYEKNDFLEEKYFGDLTNLMGYYLHAFKLTLYYLYNFEDMKKEIGIKNIYEYIIFSICDFGGDTDTNAAIVGMIMGPLIGIENFNTKYLDTFLNFYSEKRLIYTNVLMYFYVNYLIEITTNNHNMANDNKVNFNFFKMMDEMLNKEL